MRRVRGSALVRAVTALVAIAAATAATACSRPDGGGAAAAGARAVPVTTATVARVDVPLYLDGLGTVTAFMTVAVRTQVDGRLDEVRFREGQAVRKGDLLAVIDPRPFQVQLLQAQGALARDQAQLESNRRDLKRYEELASRKLIAQQQADDQRSLVGQGEGLVRVDEGAIAAAKLNLDYARITAPLDGVLGIRNVDPGNLVHAADLNGIVVLTQLDPIAVIFTLPQDVLPEVAAAQGKAPMEVKVYSRDGGALLGSGTLQVIDNAINATTATLRLKAILPNPDHSLWPNEFVKARLLVSVHAGAIIVPAQALQRGPSGTFVYVVGADQTVQPRTVQLDRVQGEDALIAKGLEAGEIVVSEGQNQLRAGSKVAPRGAAGVAGAVAGTPPGTVATPVATPDGAPAAAPGAGAGTGAAPQGRGTP
jgi:multidrug efflux system membrane fusion protein